MAAAPPDIERPSRRRSVADAVDRPPVPGPRERRRVSHVAVGADVGRRFCRRVVRVGTAARRDSRTRYLRRGARSAVGGKYGRSLDEDGGRRRNATPRSGRARSIHLVAGGGRPRCRSRYPSERRCRAHRRARRASCRRHAQFGRQIGSARSRIECGSTEDIAGAGGSNRARAGVPRAHAELPLHRQCCEGEPGAEPAPRIHARLAEICARLEGSSRSVQLSITWSARSTRRNMARTPRGRTWRSPSRRSQIPSLAPAGAHVMSITAQFAPYRLRGGIEWSAAGRTFRGCGDRHVG